MSVQACDDRPVGTSYPACHRSTDVCVCHLRHLIKTGGRTRHAAYVGRIGRGGPLTEMMRAYSNSRSGNLGLGRDDADPA